jgi:hypothetical protein
LSLAGLSDGNFYGRNPIVGDSSKPSNAAASFNSPHARGSLWFPRSENYVDRNSILPFQKSGGLTVFIRRKVN